MLSWRIRSITDKSGYTLSVGAQDGKKKVFDGPAKVALIVGLQVPTATLIQDMLTISGSMHGTHALS